MGRIRRKYVFESELLAVLPCSCFLDCKFVIHSFRKSILAETKQSKESRKERFERKEQRASNHGHTDGARWGKPTCSSLRTAQHSKMTRLDVSDAPLRLRFDHKLNGGTGWKDNLTSVAYKDSRIRRLFACRWIFELAGFRVTCVFVCSGSGVVGWQGRGRKGEWKRKRI